MRTVLIERNGGPEVLQVADRPVPEPGPEQVLVAATVAGVNYRDVYEREGGYGGEPPLIVGIEGAGEIVAVGESVAALAVGDRVVWSSAPGSYAEQVVVDAARAVPIPDGVTDEIAAAVLLQGMTAQYLCTDTYPVRAGDTVVVHAAAGGVGLLLTQLVKLRGGRVIATTSTDEKAALARDAGADEVIGYEGFGKRVRELTGGVGVPAVFDGIGKATFDESLSCLRPRGIMVTYGSASGPAPAVEPQRLVSGGSLFLTRPSLQHYTLTREELLERAGDVLGRVAAGQLDVRIGGRYPLEDVRRAHEDLESRRTTGKLLLMLT